MICIYLPEMDSCKRKYLYVLLIIITKFKIIQTMRFFQNTPSPSRERGLERFARASIFLFICVHFRQICSLLNHRHSQDRLCYP